MNLFELLENTEKNFPRKDAVIMNDIHYTYRQIVESIRNFSSVLQQQGVRAQQKVGLMFPNGADYIVAFFSN